MRELGFSGRRDSRRRGLRFEELGLAAPPLLLELFAALLRLRAHLLLARFALFARFARFVLLLRRCQQSLGIFNIAALEPNLLRRADGRVAHVRQLVRQLAGGARRLELLAHILELRGRRLNLDFLDVVLARHALAKGDGLERGDPPEVFVEADALEERNDPAHEEHRAAAVRRFDEEVPEERQLDEADVARAGERLEQREHRLRLEQLARAVEEARHVDLEQPVHEREDLDVAEQPQAEARQVGQRLVEQLDAQPVGPADPQREQLEQRRAEVVQRREEQRGAVREGQRTGEVRHGGPQRVARDRREQDARPEDVQRIRELQEGGLEAVARVLVELILAPA